MWSTDHLSASDSRVCLESYWQPVILWHTLIHPQSIGHHCHQAWGPGYKESGVCSWDAGLAHSHQADAEHIRAFHSQSLKGESSHIYRSGLNINWNYTEHILTTIREMTSQTEITSKSLSFLSPVWRLTLITPALGRLRQEDCYKYGWVSGQLGTW